MAKKIVGIRKKDGWLYRAITPEFKGSSNEYISIHYEIMENGFKNNLWDISGEGDTKGLFRHWDYEEY